MFKARRSGWLELFGGKVETVWTGSWTRSLEPDGDTQLLFCRQRGCLGISRRKHHDCIHAQDESCGNAVKDSVKPDKAQGRACGEKRRARRRGYF